MTPEIGSERYGLIAGNGRFPVLALETARRLGHSIVVIAIEMRQRRKSKPWARRSTGSRLRSLAN